MPPFQASANDSADKYSFASLANPTTSSVSLDEENEEGQANDFGDELNDLCNNTCSWSLFLFTSAWVWVLFLVLLLYAADSCQPGISWMIGAVVLLFLILTCGGCPSWFGNFPWVLAVSVSILITFFTLSLIERPDPVYYAHGVPVVEAYVSDYCVVAQRPQKLGGGGGHRHSDGVQKAAEAVHHDPFASMAHSTHAYDLALE